MPPGTLLYPHHLESRDEEFLFAFLAAYTTKGENEQVTHVPLQYALTEYKNEREKLLERLACLNRAAEETFQLLHYKRPHPPMFECASKRQN